MPTTAIVKTTEQAIEPTNKREYYDSLSAKEAEISKDCGKRYHSGAIKFSDGILEAGTALIEAKEKLGHGKFMQFCKHELGDRVSHDTIENLMRSAKAIKANPTLIKFNPSAIFTLTKSSTPPEVVAELTAKAEAGEPIPSVREIKETIAEAKTQTPNIKKGDLVEWQDVDLKGYKYGRVARKSTDGITVKLQNLSGMPLGERPTKFVSLCPVQKVNEDSVSFSQKLTEGDLFIAKPYCSWLQKYAGKTGKAISLNPKKFSVTLMFDDGIQEFHWEEIEKEEIEKIEQQQEPQKTQSEEEAIIDVEATEIAEEAEEQAEEQQEETRYINGLPIKGNELQKLVKEVYARVEELDNHQIEYLLDGLKREVAKRTSTQTKIA